MTQAAPTAPRPGLVAAAELAAAMDGGDLPRAERLWASLPRGLRQKPRIALLHVRLLAARGDSDTALDVCEALWRARPTEVVMQALLDLLLETGRLAEAANLLERDLWPSSAPTEVKLSRLDRLSRGLAPEVNRALLARLRLAANASGVDGEVRIRLATAEFSSGRYEQVLAVLDDEPTCESAPMQALTLRSRALVRLGRRQEALVSAEAALRARRISPEHLARVLRLLLAEDRKAEALERLEAALIEAPRSAALLAQTNLLPLANEDLRRIYAVALRSHHACAMAGPALRDLAILALQMRDVETVTAIMADHPDAFAPVAPLISLFGTGSRRLTDDRSAAMQCVRTPGAVATLVVFPGARNRIGGIPFHLMDAVLEHQPVNVIYLRDFRHRTFLEGIGGLGDGQAGSALGLQRLAAQLGAPRLVMAGMSGGGFAAIRYGALAGAGAVLGFSALTRLLSLEEKAAEPDGGFAHAALGAFAPRDRDTRPDVEANPAMRVVLTTVADNAEDLRQAERLAGLPNVSLRIVPGLAKHGQSLLAALVTGLFSELLETAIAA